MKLVEGSVLVVVVVVCSPDRSHPSGVDKGGAVADFSRVPARFNPSLGH